MAAAVRPRSRRNWQSVRGDEEDPGLPVESAYEHVGMDHLTSVGEASASLGLISTLVFSICIGSIMQSHASTHELAYICLALGTLGSTYTTAYSLLEYFYVQTLKGIDLFIAQRHFQPPRAPSEGPRPPSEASVRVLEAAHAPAGAEQDPRGARRKPNSARGFRGVEQDRAELVVEAEEAFASFNDMREWARNSMWISMVALIGAAMCKISPLGPLAPNPSLAIKTAGFFSVSAALFTVAQCSGFQTRDIVVYTCISAGGIAVGGLVGMLDRPPVDLARLSSGGFLLSSIFVVPITVRAFRRAFAEKVRRHASIH